ncbi:MAG: hypothetical protein Q9191_004919 [Dirinaria sp. TL-2023a]
MFVHLWPVRAPGDDRFSKVHSPLHHMLTAPVSKSQEKGQTKNSRGPKPPSAGNIWENKYTPVVAYLTSVDDLRENDYVIHPAHLSSTEEKEHEASWRKLKKQSVEDGWIDTKIENLEEGDLLANPITKGNISAGRSILAIDCEMCTVEGGEAALTRISIVNWDRKVVMDELVKPSTPIIDYLTPYSGITKDKLASTTTTLNDIQQRLLTLIKPQTILVGQSLNSDLDALKLTHPFIIDTAILYPHPRGPPLKSSLKWLSKRYLNREIQKGHGSTGHNSIEDARVCIDLVRLKCEKGPDWGSQDAERESIFKRLSRVPKPGRVSKAHDAHDGKTGAIIDHGKPEKNFGHMATYSIGCSTDDDVVAGIRRAVLGDESGSYIPGGGVDFTSPARLVERQPPPAKGLRHDDNANSKCRRAVAIHAFKRRRPARAADQNRARLPPSLFPADRIHRHGRSEGTGENADDAGDF